MTIKEAREKAGLTQMKVAHIFGVSKRAVEEWEAGRRNPKDRNTALKILTYGNLTSEGREALLDPDDSFGWEDALREYKISTVKKMSAWGKYNDTFELLWERIPASIVEQCSASSLAVLIDSIKRAYDDGVEYGRHIEE
jgi:DNA-binding XRE family transcriptional regulator